MFTSSVDLETLLLWLVVYLTYSTVPYLPVGVVLPCYRPGTWGHSASPQAGAPDQVLLLLTCTSSKVPQVCQALYLVITDEFWKASVAWSGRAGHFHVLLANVLGGIVPAACQVQVPSAIKWGALCQLLPLLRYPVGTCNSCTPPNLSFSLSHPYPHCHPPITPILELDDGS